MKAFEVDLIDYLLKPIDREQMRRALGKLERLRGGPKPEWRALVEELALKLRAELERKLDPKRFVRIHRAVLLNLGWVGEVHSRFGGRMTMGLKDAKQTQLPVARDRARALKERLDLY